MLGCLAHIAPLRDFGCFLCFACFGCFDCHYRFLYFGRSYFLIGIASWFPFGGLCCYCSRIPMLVPTGGLCRRQFRIACGPSWRRSPYYGRNHFVAVRHDKVWSYSRSRPSRTAVTLSWKGLYGFCGSHGVRSVCRADHRSPHPKSRACLYGTATHGVLGGFWP